MTREEMTVLIFALLSLSSLQGSSGDQCGKGAEGALCPDRLCCSKWGYCGSTADYCDAGCQSNCWNSTPPPPPASPSPPPPPVTPSPPTPPGPDNITSVITSSLFDDMLMHRSSSGCHGGFYTYEAFLTAANAFSGFGTTGDLETRKREVAAFFGQTSQETTGGWPDAPDGPYTWGYCWVKERNPADYCVESTEWPCVPGKQYYGRGPIQLSYNYNYGQAGQALGLDLLNNPDLVENDPVIAFKTAIWFWMTTQKPKPSCHDVITGEWTPSRADLDAGRVPGLGVITNIINGGLECGHGPDQRVYNRIQFYKRYCDMMNVSYGDNLDCYNQRPFSWGFSENLGVFSSK